MNESRASLTAAVVAAISAVLAAGIAAYSAYSVGAAQERFAERQAGADFLAERLTKLYVPVSMHLVATKALFDRFVEPNVSAAEKTALEHELRFHNNEIRRILLESSVYAVPANGGSPGADQLLSDLLEHLVQWETVYKLKYEYGVYEGPVFAGIADFGFRGFPPEADTYFHTTEMELRRRLHELRSAE
jgi:hypothetical protein